MNWLSFFGSLIAGVIVGLNNFLLFRFLFLHYDKSVLPRHLRKHIN